MVATIFLSFQIASVIVKGLFFFTIIQDDGLVYYMYNVDTSVLIVISIQ